MVKNQTARLGIKESRAFVMPNGFNKLKPEHRYRATRVNCFNGHPVELIRKEASKFDPVSLPLSLLYSTEDGRKRLERTRLVLIQKMPKPRLP